MFGSGLEQLLRDELSRRAHFAAVLPMPEPVPAPGTRALVDAIRGVVAHDGAGVDLHPLMKNGGGERPGPLARLIRSKAPVLTGRDYFLVVADVALWIAWRDTKVAQYGDLDRFVNPEVWPEGARVLAGHRTHVEVCDLGLMSGRPMPALDAAFNRAIAVTAAVAAVTQIAVPSGLLWHPARSALPPALFRDQLGRALHGKAPLELWMRWFYLRGGEGQRPGVITRGLAPLIGREIEVLPSSRPESEALSLAFATASLLIDHGGRVSDGQLLKPVPGLSARVRLGDSATRKGLPVIELTVPEPVRKSV